jgi:hypothetical protein
MKVVVRVKVLSWSLDNGVDGQLLKNFHPTSLLGE